MTYSAVQCRISKRPETDIWFRHLDKEALNNVIGFVRDLVFDRIGVRPQSGGFFHVVGNRLLDCFSQTTDRHFFYIQDRQFGDT